MTAGSAGFRSGTIKRVALTEFSTISLSTVAIPFTRSTSAVRCAGTGRSGSLVAAGERACVGDGPLG